MTNSTESVTWSEDVATFVMEHYALSAVVIMLVILSISWIIWITKTFPRCCQSWCGIPAKKWNYDYEKGNLEEEKSLNTNHRNPVNAIRKRTYIREVQMSIVSNTSSISEINVNDMVELVDWLKEEVKHSIYNGYSTKGKILNDIKKLIKTLQDFDSGSDSVSPLTSQSSTSPTQMRNLEPFENMDTVKFGTVIPSSINTISSGFEENCDTSSTTMRNIEELVNFEMVKFKNAKKCSNSTTSSGFEEHLDQTETNDTPPTPNKNYIDQFFLTAGFNDASFEDEIHHPARSANRINGNSKPKFDPSIAKWPPSEFPETPDLIKGGRPNVDLTNGRDSRISDLVGGNGEIKPQLNPEESSTKERDIIKKYPDLPKKPPIPPQRTVSHLYMKSNTETPGDKSKLNISQDTQKCKGDMVTPIQGGDFQDPFPKEISAEMQDLDSLMAEILLAANQLNHIND